MAEVSRENPQFEAFLRLLHDAMFSEAVDGKILSGGEFDDGWQKLFKKEFPHRLYKECEKLFVFTPPMQTGGRKDDDGKPRMDLIPPELLYGVAAVLGYGAKKYGDRNWEKGIQFSRLFAALQRHLWAWWSREEYDLESEQHHLHHAACCLAFLIALRERRGDLDDRASSTD